MLKGHGDKSESVLVERTTLYTILGAVGAALLGCLLLFVSSLRIWGTQSPWQSLVANLGGLLVASVAIAVLWELAGKRAFVDEIMSKARLSHDLLSAGLMGITEDFNKGIDWDRLFAESDKVDLFFAYARSWRNTHSVQLQALGRRSDARIRIILPDPDDEVTVADLAPKFGYEVSQLRELILEASKAFQQIRPTSGQRCSSVSLWYLKASPLYTMYRFGRKSILVFYSHRRELVPVPALICEQGGTLFDFASQDFHAMINAGSGLTRLVWEQNS